MTIKKTVKTTKKTAVAAAPDKTVKRNGIVYSLITPSHLTKLKNDAKRAKAAVVAAPAKTAAAPVTAQKAVAQGKAIMANSPATIPGSTDSTFNVFASSPRGIAAFRSLGGTQYRVRVVPNNGTVLPLNWAVQPLAGVRKHYSQVVDLKSLPELVAQATFALFAA